MIAPTLQKVQKGMDAFRRFNMKQVSYKKLWHTLIDRNLRKNDLLNATGISSSTLARMVSGQPVNVEILLRICSALDCDFSDIMEAVPEGKDNPPKKKLKKIFLSNPPGH